MSDYDDEQEDFEAEDGGEVDADESAPTKKKGAKKGKRAKKDPKKPKGPLSAYMCFAKNVRPAILEQNPGISMPEVSKLIGAKWKDLSDDDKEPFKILAAQDKERHTEQMKGYKPPPPDPDEGDEENSAKKSKGKGGKAAKGGKGEKKPKKVKDPNAPKKPITAYLAYSNDHRGAVKQEHPDWSTGEISKYLGAQWKTLSDEEKAPYMQIQKDAKAKYDKLKEEYEKSGGPKKAAAAVATAAAAAEDEGEEEEQDDEE